MITIIDYGAGNLASVANALKCIGAEYRIADRPDEVNCDAIILPGVGAFGFMMESLRTKGLEMPIKNAIAGGTKFLGICLGMQVLFEGSEESPGVSGLGIFPGRVVRFRKGKVPQVGWNKVIPRKPMFSEGYSYFVNSYYVVPGDEGIVAAVSDYYSEFVCAVQSGNVTAVQFHPEKSGDFGIEFLRRWLKC
ncbi:MAG: imidazole glycerol phosphate synthase subunit HisH [archaeon]